LWLSLVSCISKNFFAFFQSLKPLVLKVGFSLSFIGYCFQMLQNDESVVTLYSSHEYKLYHFS
jgi:hypothetical protein